MITPTQLRDRFPGVFDGLMDANLQPCIDEAAAAIREDVWGADYDTGLLYLTAHLVVKTILPGAENASAVGPVKRRRIGDVDVEFAVPAGAETDEGLLTTAFGSRFVELRKAYQGGPVVPHAIF